MNHIVGFAISDRLSKNRLSKIQSTMERALRYFPWLNRSKIHLGNARLDIWGHGSLTDCIHRDADNNLLVLVGSPPNSVPWHEIERILEGINKPEKFRFPWEGRCILLKISPDGQRWRMWNDWCGSIPVFHARIDEGRIASTLEPVAVDAAGYTPDDFFLPGLVSLLINGHYLGDWTLFKGMKVLPPDCAAEWDNKGFGWKRLWTVKPSDGQWDKGWDKLVDEMYELSRQAIIDVLKTQSSWILPLSGGLDSRLVAAVGAEMGVDLHVYTYGPPTWGETVYASQVAKVLGLSWKRIDLGIDYLAKYTGMWADWFGSALHFHGMYQTPFLQAIRQVDTPIVMGFIGDPLAGAQTAGMMQDKNISILERLVNKWHMWPCEEINVLFRSNISQALEEIHAELKRQYEEIPGEPYQRIWFIFWWNHVFGFSYYQPMMYDYWKGVATPYLNVKYGRFSLSLPRLALEDRRLQKEMFRRYYPKMAAIGGTYGKIILPGGRYVLKQVLARRLPRQLRKGPLREFNITPNTLDRDCIRATKHTAVWPIFEVKHKLSEWVNMDMVEEAYKAAMAGNLQACNKLESIQALAHRLLDDKTDFTKP